MYRISQWFLIAFLFAGAPFSASAQQYYQSYYNQSGYQAQGSYYQNQYQYPNQYGTSHYGYGSATASATGVNSDSATLSGTVNPQGQQGTAWFEYGTTPSLGAQAGFQSIGAGTTPVTVVATLRNLAPSTTYYFRLVAQTGMGGTQSSQVQSFQTPAVSAPTPSYPGGPSYPGTPSSPLSVFTGSASSVGSQSATLHGSVSGGSGTTWAFFEYGTSADPSTRSPARYATENGLSVTFRMSGLAPGTTYYYRMVGQQTNGETVRGALKKFTTDAAVAAPTVPAAPVATSTPSAPVATSTAPAGVALTLETSLDRSELKKGEDANYTVKYKNASNRTLTAAKLTVTFPAEQMDYVVSTLVPKVEGNQLTYDLGSLKADAEGQVLVRFKVKDSASAGQSLPIGAVLAYGYGTETRYANSNLSVYLGNANQAANVSSTVGGWSWYTWVFVLVLLLLIAVAVYVAYRYIRSKRAISRL